MRGPLNERLSPIGACAKRGCRRLGRWCLLAAAAALHALLPLPGPLRLSAPQPLPQPLPLPLPPPAGAALGGGHTLPWHLWDARQALLDCVAREGAWAPQAEAQLIVTDAASLYAGGEACGRAPYSRSTDPAFFYNVSLPRGACGGIALPAFSAEKFCALLGGRDLLIVGDSTSFTLHESAMGALDLVPAYARGGGAFSAVPHDHLDACAGHAVCGGRASVRYVHNDRVGAPPLPSPPPRPRARDAQGAIVLAHDEHNHLQPFLHLVTNATLLLLNRGAHWRPEEEVVRELLGVLAAVRARAPGAGIVVRSTPPGHAPAVEAQAPPPSRALLPLRSPKEAAAALAAAPAGYHYADFARLNAALAAALPPGVVYLDVEPLTLLRPDHHTDPLHYCVPGPTDWWVWLLQVALEVFSEPPPLQ